jgi:hypothetical protein
MTTIAAEAAPETDRLVLGTNRGRDDHLITQRALDVGVEQSHLLGHWWDFLLAGTLTREIARLRSRYRPPGEVDRVLDRLVADGHVLAEDSRLVATASLVPVLHVIRDETARSARTAWTGHDEAMATVRDGAERMTAAADLDAVAAIAHRDLPTPDDPFLALYLRLTTIRYVRQHDHAAAWAAHGLTAQQMRNLPDLWHGEPVAADASGLDVLEERDLVGPGGGLTDVGRRLREQIEAETLERSARTYDALGDDGPTYLAAIRALPTPGAGDGSAPTP